MACLFCVSRFVLILIVIFNFVFSIVSSLVLSKQTFSATTPSKTSSYFRRNEETHKWHSRRRPVFKHECMYSSIQPRSLQTKMKSYPDKTDEDGVGTISTMKKENSIDFDVDFKPLEIVANYISSSVKSEAKLSALRPTILHVPPSILSENVQYNQKATSTQIFGNQTLLEWECGKEMIELLSEENGGGCSVSCFTTNDIVQIDPDTILVKWNVTWIPPTTSWLQALGKFAGWTIIKRPYNEMSNSVSVFRWGAIIALFSKAFNDGILTLPLACIEGRSLLRFTRNNFDNHHNDGSHNHDEKQIQESTPMSSPPLSYHWKLTSITEEISYAEDLKRNVLQNRRCAQDLRLFLELGRKPPLSSWEEWENKIQTCLPWASVPGFNSLDIEPMSSEEGNLPAFIFLGIVGAITLTFANVLAPELIGQSLFGPPNYIVDPSELNSFY
mmetsp:Transcript_10455/g.14805  ORF Transcript_10455/g.14805 Transcript_10455/m.14805 type:complete len:443 (+) Transcript_10455:51-1379(+)